MSSSCRFSVTGSMAVGKTTVCSLLTELGSTSGIPVTVVDADKLRVEILQGTNPKFIDIQNRLVIQLGSGITDRNGVISRLLLSELIFGNNSALNSYKKILFPAMEEELALVVNNTSGIVLLDYALTTEQKLLALTDYNALLIGCTEKEQLNRLTDSDLPPSQQKQRISLQMNTREKKKSILNEQLKSGCGILLELDTTVTPSNRELEAILYRMYEQLKEDSDARKAN